MKSELIYAEEKPTRIAVVAGNFSTGGVRSVIMNYYKSIDRKKFQFDFIIEMTNDDQDFSEIVNMGGRVFKVTPINKNLFKNIIETVRILKFGKYTFVHGYLNTLNIFPMFSGYLAKTKIRIAENLSTAHPKEPKTRIKNILRPFASSFSTDLAANSFYSAEWIYGQKKAENVLILRNGLDLNKFTYSKDLRDTAREQLNLTNEFLIGHVGRYQFQKNHSFLIDIFFEVIKFNPKARLLLIGYGELKEKIWNKIEELELNDFVIDGGASTENVANYNAMDCFLMPSFYEGLPVVGIEAQATGLPCVFSTEITKEAKIIDSVDFLSLDADIQVWRDTILKYESRQRNNSTEILRSAGYDIKECAKELMEFYENSQNR